MRTALVRVSPLEVVQEWSELPAKISVPGVGDVHCAEVGWESPKPKDEHGHFTSDPTYRLVEVSETGEAPTQYHDESGETLSLSGSVLTREKKFTARNLDDVKADLLRAVDAKAGDIRGLYITVAPGQEMTYQEKARQARELLMDPEPQDEAYPMIAGLVGIRGETLQDVAELIAAKEGEWQQVGAQIETVREGAKVQIAAAESIEDALAIYNNAAWPQ